MITVRNVTKNFGAHPILKGVDLQVDEGEYVSLVGPNGSGKTTLLRIIATLSRQTSGSVSVGGWDYPGEANRVRRHIGYVSHEPLLYRDLTAAENLTFFARLYNLDFSQHRIDLALKQVGLFARQHDPVALFSRGMLQRLTLARATLHEPDILLLDEPHSGLDQDASLLLDGLLREESAKGRTILMITHDLVRAVEQSDRVAVLHQGRIADIFLQGDRSPHDFLQQYARVTHRSGKQVGEGSKDG